MRLATCFLWTAAVAAGCVVPSMATATVAINIDFEGDAIGAAPATNLTPGDPMTQPSAIGGYNPAYESPPTPAAGSVVVGTPSGATNEAVMTTNQNNANLGAIWMDVNGFSIAAQQFHLSFDVNVLAAPDSATTQPKNLGMGTAGILLGMNAYTSSDQGSDWSFRFAAAPTSAGGGVFAFRSPDNNSLIPFYNYVEGVQYSIAIEADYSTGTLDAYVNGVQQMSDYAFWLAGKTNVATNELFFHLNGEGAPPFSSSVALDNIAAYSAVPEAGGALFGGLACAVAGLVADGRRWRANN